MPPTPPTQKTTQTDEIPIESVGTTDIKTFQSMLKAIIAEIGNRIIRGYGATVKTSILLETITTIIIGFFYNLRKEKHVSLFGLVVLGKRYYTSKSQFYNEYYRTAMERIRRQIRKLWYQGYKIDGIQLIFVGNLSRKLIREVRSIRYIEVDGKKFSISVRVAPAGKQKFHHRIGQVVLKDFLTVAKAVIYSLASWFRERFVNLHEFLKKVGEGIKGNPLAKAIGAIYHFLFYGLKWRGKPLLDETLKLATKVDAIRE